jgi:NadR type nicotinamide-nucleotide adenylyltransferase
MKQRKPTKGVVLGDFTPLINAHVHMIEFARGYVDELTIVVDEHANDSIPIAVRVKWLSELFPNVPVKRVKSAVWHKSDDKGFSQSLVAGVRRLIPKSGGYIFSLEERGKVIAAQLGATFIPVDPSLAGFCVSERDVRKDPLKHWEELARAVRPHFVRKVCVFGPESTGKSTLALKLAKRFGTVAVPEYAKTYIASMGRDITSDDMLMIARGQVASEDALAHDANRVMFCDSDIITSSIWSGRLVGTVPEWLREQADKRHYDLYLLTDIDVPWVDDVHRYIPKERQTFLDRCILELESRQRPFAHVKGGWDERLEAAVKAVEEMLAVPR